MNQSASFWQFGIDNLPELFDRLRTAEEHSIDEERYITIGLSNMGRLLLVAHAERDDRIRIITARKATKNEEKFYQEAG